MLVPRSFAYSSTKQHLDEKIGRREMRTSSNNMPRKMASTVHKPAARTPTEPVTIPSHKAIHTEKQLSRESEISPSFKSATVGSRRRKLAAHDPNAISPSVAALLAMTAIPPRRPNRNRSLSNPSRNVSIEELVSEWKSDDSLKSGYSTSPALSALLEEIDDGEEQRSRTDIELEDGSLKTRSVSSDSVPSLDTDNRSILSSVESPSTPGSIRSRGSISNLRKSTKTVEDCMFDHPLVPQAEEDKVDEFQFPIQKVTPEPTKARSSFKSNLTASLQSLKNAAISSISSISSLSRSNNTTSLNSSTTLLSTPHLDEMLWSHPFLFPRFSSETRPIVADGLSPSEAQRRYLNAIPLTFEELEAPFQQALHAPYLAADAEVEDGPIIQMQTYSRHSSRRGRSSNSHSRRNSASSRASGPDPNSEAGRALLGAAGVRHREIRENSNFLRVVVLEMNMRRMGKLESGRARIWLPPREVVIPGRTSDGSSINNVRVPRRWVGESAY